MTRTRLILVLPLLLALVAALLAACGGDSAPSDEEYFRKMDEIDKELDTQFDNIDCDETSTAKECATGFGDAVSVAVTKHSDVKPSDAAKDENEELVAALKELSDKIESAEFQDADTPDAFFEIFDTERVDDAFCAIQDLADEKNIEADVGCAVSEAVDPSTLPPVEATEVLIENFAFDPPHIQVAAGDTVTWTQGADGAPHTATADDDTFDSGNLTDEGETFEFTFDDPGEYSYFCELHPEMLGLVTVTE
jgi:plastocyanin